MTDNKPLVEIGVSPAAFTKVLLYLLGALFIGVGMGIVLSPGWGYIAEGIGFVCVAVVISP